MRRYSWWVRAVSGGNVFSRNTEALLVGPSCHGKDSFFWRNKEVLACVRPWTMWVPTVSLSMYVPLPMLSFVDNIDHAMPSTPARWTMARPMKGMTRRRQSHNSGGMRVSRGMSWLAVGVVGGSESCAASQSAMGGGSRRSRRRWIWRLEQEDRRLKKHYGRWMDIIQSLELESCILTKLTKPSVPVNLVGPQVSLPPRWVPASREYSFFCA